MLVVVVAAVAVASAVDDGRTAPAEVVIVVPGVAVDVA